MAALSSQLLGWPSQEVKVMVKVGQSYLAIAVSAATAKNHGNKKGEAARGKSTDSKTAL